MTWIDIPACRVLEVTQLAFLEDYKCYGEDGEPIKRKYGNVYRVVRLSDCKVFKPASFIPVESFARDCFYLEEL